MAYFSYTLSGYLTVPLSVSSNGINLTYAGNSLASLTAPTTLRPTSMSGQDVQNNFFFLGAGLQDTTTRVSLIENLNRTVADNTPGYMTYYGLAEVADKLYGGSPLVLTGSTTGYASYAFNTSINRKSLRVSTDSGVVLSGSSVVTGTSKYVTFILDSVSFPSAPSSGTTNATAVNAILKGNSKVTYSAGSATYFASQISTTSVSYTGAFSASSSFFVSVNNGYTNGGSGTPNQELVTTVPISESPSSTNVSIMLTSVIQTAIASLKDEHGVNYSGTNVTVTGTWPSVTLVLATPDRTLNQPYEVTLTKNGGATWDVLTYLQWIGASYNNNCVNAGLGSSNLTQCSVYDYSTVINFGITSSGYLSLSGTRWDTLSTSSVTVSYFKLALQDSDSTATYGGLFAGTGGITISTSAPYYHVRLPLSSYNSTLNFGGFFASAGLISTDGLTVTAGGYAVTGNSTVTGTLTSSGALTVSSGGLTVTAGGVNVTGSGVFASGIAVTGTATAGTVTSTGLLTVSSGGAVITGNSTVNGSLNVTGTLTVGAGFTYVSTIPRIDYASTTSAYPTSGVQINFDAIIDSGVSGQFASLVTTGAGVWKFTVTSSGVYDVEFTSLTTFNPGTGTIAINIWKNGAFNSTLCAYKPASTTTGTSTMSGAKSVRLIVGDYIDIRPYYTGLTLPAFDTGGSSNYDGRARVVIQYLGA